MDFGEREYPDKPTDRLERQVLPPTLEEAEAEYFADMAFDDRLLALLDKYSPTVISTVSHTVTSHQDGIAARYFTSNTTEPHEIVIDEDTIEEIEQPAFAYTLQGTLMRHPERIELHCVILPEDSSATRITLQSDPDNNDLFYLSKTEKDNQIDIDLVDSKDLFAILCQLGGINMQPVSDFYTSLAQLDQDKIPIIHAHIEDFWDQLADAHGKKEAVHQIVHQVTKPALAQHPETITLTRKEIEQPQQTFIELNLEHATDMPELNAQEAYCLKLSFEHTTGRPVEKNAEKIIRSKDTPRLVGITFHRRSGGRITQLDITDIKVKELFINWFDQVISD